MATNYVAPVSGTWIANNSNLFGATRGNRGRNHGGNDLHAPNGSTAVAAIGGTVLYADKNKGYGYNAVVLGDDGNAFRYATHGPLSVKVGDRVEQGQPIGTIAPATRDGAPHLHFEVIPAGSPVLAAMKANPGKFIDTQWWGKNAPVTVDPAAFFGVERGTQIAAGQPLSGVPQDAQSAIASLMAPAGGTQVPDAPTALMGYAPNLPGGMPPAPPAPPVQTAAAPPPMALPSWAQGGFPDMTGGAGPETMLGGLAPPMPPSREQGMANAFERAMFSPDRPGGMSPGRQRPDTFQWMGGGAPDASKVPTPGVSPLRPAVGGMNDRRPQPPMPSLRPDHYRSRPPGGPPPYPAAEMANMPGMVAPPPQALQSLVAGRDEFPGSMPPAAFQTPYGGRPESPGGMPAASPQVTPPVTPPWQTYPAIDPILYPDAVIGTKQGADQFGPAVGNSREQADLFRLIQREPGPFEQPPFQSLVTGREEFPGSMPGAPVPLVNRQGMGKDDAYAPPGPVDGFDRGAAAGQVMGLPPDMNSLGWGPSFNPSLLTDLGILDANASPGRAPDNLSFDAMPPGPASDTWQRFQTKPQPPQAPPLFDPFGALSRAPPVDRFANAGQPPPIAPAPPRPSLAAPPDDPYAQQRMGGSQAINDLNYALFNKVGLPPPVASSGLPMPPPGALLRPSPAAAQSESIFAPVPAQVGINRVFGSPNPRQTPVPNLAIPYTEVPGFDAGRLTDVFSPGPQPTSYTPFVGPIDAWSAAENAKSIGGGSVVNSVPPPAAPPNVYEKYTDQYGPIDNRSQVQKGLSTAAPPPLSAPPVLRQTSEKQGLPAIARAALALGLGPIGAIGGGLFGGRGGGGPGWLGNGGSGFGQPPSFAWTGGGKAPYGNNGLPTNWKSGTTNALGPGKNSQVGPTNALSWQGSNGQPVTVVQDPWTGTYYGPSGSF